MKWRKFIAACMLVAVLALPGAARASSDDEDAVKHDARTEGYQPPGQVASNGTSLVWMLFVLMAAIALGVMFKDSRRSNTD